MHIKSLFLGFLSVLAGIATAGQLDVQLSEKQWMKLESFEAHSLSEADSRYTQKHWREAVAAYDSFVAEFPTSKGVPYSLTKKGLALENDDKRFKAIEAYQEILDYFPNEIAFAAPALFYTGRCHSRNGDLENALKNWAEMVTDEDYTKHPLAAFALNSLASNLMKQKRTVDAIKYYRRSAVEFKNTNHDARWAALPRVVSYYVRTAPNEAELRKFYIETSTFHHRPHRVAKDLNVDRTYWAQVKGHVLSNGGFPKDKVKERKAYYQYWTPKVADKFLGDDDYQKSVIDMYFLAEDDLAKWHERLDQQFARFQKEGDFDRITKWIRWYRSYPKKVEAYYGRYNFEKMTTAQITTVIYMFYSELGNAKLARNLLAKLRWDDMTDGTIVSVARNLWSRDTKMVEPVLAKVRSEEYRKWETLDFFHGMYDSLTDSQRKRCLPLALDVTTLDRYAQQAWYYKAHFHVWRGEYQQAIAAFRQVDDPRKTAWEIVDALLAWKKPEQAVQELLEIEQFIKEFAPTAALRIADVYRSTKERKREVSALRRVLKRYPVASQSRTAHVRLEGLGESIKAAGEGDELVEIGGAMEDKYQKNR